MGTGQFKGVVNRSPQLPKDGKTKAHPSWCCQQPELPRLIMSYHVNVVLNVLQINFCIGGKRENQNEKGKSQTHDGNQWKPHTVTSVLHGFQRKSQGCLQCKSSSSLPVCMFDSAQSFSELPTNTFCLPKACQMKCQALHSEVAECFPAAGVSFSGDGAGTTQADSGFIKGFGFVPLLTIELT